MKTQFLLANTIDELSSLLQRAEAFLEEAEVGPSVAYKVSLVLDELFTNIVSYGYPNTEKDTVIIDIEISGDLLRASINDGGIAFDPLSNSKEVDTAAAIEDRPIGGLGIFITKKICQNIRYDRRDGRNILTFQISLA